MARALQNFMLLAAATASTFFPTKVAHGQNDSLELSSRDFSQLGLRSNVTLGLQSLFKRYCPSGYGTCTSTNIPYVPEVCPSSLLTYTMTIDGGCAPLDADCCLGSSYCEAGRLCCNDGCIPYNADCCSDGTYCDTGNTCYYSTLYEGIRCCTNIQCTAKVEDDGVTTTFTTTYPYTFTW